MKFIRLMFKRDRTLEEELRLTAGVIFLCLFVLLPFTVIVSVFFGAID